MARLRSTRNRLTIRSATRLNPLIATPITVKAGSYGSITADVDHQRQQADGGGRQLAGDQPGDPRRLPGAGDDVAGESPLEEDHRQLQGVPEESQALGQRQPDLQPGEVDLLQAGGRQPHQGRRGHGDQERPEPVDVPLDEQAVDVDPLERRRGQARGSPGPARPGSRTPAPRGTATAGPPAPPAPRAGRPASRTRGPSSNVKAIPL